MAGLPKSYIKKYGISARAWREYRKAKKKRTTKKKGGGTVAKKRRSTKRRSTTRRKRPSVRTRTRTVYRRARRSARRVARRVTPRNVLPAATKAAIKTGIGVAGAAGSAALINTLPMTPQAKAWSQLALGLGTIVMTPKRAVNMKAAGTGAALVAALAIAKTSGLPVPSLMAGCDRMGLNYYPYRNSMMGKGYRNRRLLSRPYADAARSVQSRGSKMGVNIHKGGMAGYGAKFVTQANM